MERRAARTRSIATQMFRLTPSSARAFSLIELTLVLVIMGIMAAIAAPRYARSLARYRTDMAARRIASDLQVAQNRARSSSTSQTITFDTTASTYTIVGMTAPDRPGQSYVVNLKDDPYLATIGTVNFGGGGTLTFNGYGDPDSAGTITLTSGDVTRQVLLAGDTGNVTLK
jgi:prepilin-type N-terminal cleavage/methylation domain-containing protein